MSYHAKCERLRELVGLIKSNTQCKTDKARSLVVARELAQEIGFDLGNYNSGNFGVTLPEQTL